MQQLAHVTLLVHDYDEALAFYTQKLGFHLVSDTPLSATKRWVVVVPPVRGVVACFWLRLMMPRSKAKWETKRVAGCFYF
jgi:catechol 2,3-dioxygenase-like lactoylglutathione lyase family enzyme